MLRSLAHHFPNYLIEAALLALFMMSACATVALLAHPASPVARRVVHPLARRAVIGALMGLTAVLLITSPMGRLSGAHMNPAATLAFFALGKVRAWDAAFYMLAQFIGGIVGVAAARGLLRGVVAHPAVNCVATLPGEHSARGYRVAWIAEFVITFVLFGTVLIVSNRAATAAWTPYAVGALVALYITFEAPLSGMSMNPARTLGSALHARDFRALWVYFTAPPLGMLAAGLIYARVGEVYCAKMDHTGDEACLFECRIGEMRRLDEPRP